MLPASFFRLGKSAAALALAGGLLGGRAWAGSVTYEISGTATGTIGGTPFTDAAIVLTTTADTLGVTYDTTTYPGFPFWQNIGITTIQIAGIGTATFTSHDFGAFSEDLSTIFPGAGAIGIADLTLETNIFGAVVAYTGYDLTTAVMLSTGTASFVAGPFSTTLGDLVLSNSATDFAFVTVVPESGRCGLAAGIGLAGIVVRRRYSARAV
jgi:hypothetical protein